MKNSIAAKDVSFAMQEEATWNRSCSKMCKGFSGNGRTDTDSVWVILAITANTFEKDCSIIAENRGMQLPCYTLIDDPGGYGRIIRDEARKIPKKCGA